MQDELINLLVEDLTALSTLLYSKDALPPSHVRIVASSVLRKWLIDGLISKLSSFTKAAYTFKTYDTKKIVELVNAKPHIAFYTAGGIMLDGIPITGIYSSDAPYSGIPELPRIELKLFSLSDLMKSKRIYFNKNWFNTEQVVRFVANKVGGIHFDTNREHEWHKTIEEASNYLITGNPNRLTVRQIIEPYNEKHRILIVLPKETGYKWNCLDIELLAAAQAFLHIHVDGEQLVKFERE